MTDRTVRFYGPLILNLVRNECVSIGFVLHVMWSIIVLSLLFQTFGGKGLNLIQTP